MSNSNSFSKREWIMLIVIILMIQFIIHWLSLKYGGSTSALGYVSFAGTVVSILLGLVAIIYAFVQSFTQANSVVEIREQVDKLILAGDDIIRSKDGLHKSALELSEITDELSTKINESILATREVAGNVVRLSDAFALQRSTVEVEAGASGGAGAVGSQTKTVFNSSRILLSITVKAIAEGAGLGLNLDEIRDKIAIPVGEEIGYKSDFMAGLFFMGVFTLESEGFISLVKKKNSPWDFVCENDFLAKCDEAFSRSLADKHKEHAALWSVVDELKSTQVEEGVEAEQDQS